MTHPSASAYDHSAAQIRVRPTLRCLRDDLGIPLPDKTSVLDDFGDAVLELIRDRVRAGLQATDQPIVVETPTHIARLLYDAAFDTWWICDVTPRSRTTGLAPIAAPDNEDRRRVSMERKVRAIRTAAFEASGWMQAALELVGESRWYELEDGVNVCVFCEVAAGPVFIAIPLGRAGGPGVHDVTADQVLAVLTTLEAVDSINDCDAWPGEEELEPKRYQLAKIIFVLPPEPVSEALTGENT